MYWCNPRKQHVCVLLLIVVFWTCIFGCKPEVKQGNGSLRYFDLKRYFNAEATRLNLKQTPILKTASYNGHEYTKPAKIKNWKRELALFIESDINKASWKDSYQVKSNADSIVYNAIDTALHIRQILVILRDTQVRSVRIKNFTKNLLYQTKEQLTYFPDSLYSIKKNQKILFLGLNNYTITGKFR